MAIKKIPSVSYNYEVANSEIDIVDLEVLQQRAKQVTPHADSPHRLSFNMIVFIESGTGEQFIDFERVSFGPASILFLQKGQVQAFDFRSKLKGKVVLFTEKFVNAIHANSRIPFLLSSNMVGEFAPHLTLCTSLKKSLMRLIEEIEKELVRPDPDEAISMSIFSALLMMLGRERNNPAKNLRRQEAQMFTNFIRLIEQHHSSTREANYYAQSLNTTYKTLNQLCKKISGRTAKYHIDEYIILEAKRQLTIDRLDIASLAYDLGFDEPTNFTKFFKRHTGRTPKQFQV